MDGGSFNLEVAQFELDQARRRREAETAERASTEPLSAPAAAWVPLFIWMTAASTVLIYFANA